MGSAGNITIRNVKATGAKWALMLVGSKDCSIDGVTLENIDVAFARGPGGKKNSPFADREVGQNTSAYPQSRMFKTLNAWGLFARNADNITLKDVNFRAEGKSRAHMTYFENVKGVLLDNMQVFSPENEPAWIKANGLSDAKLGVSWPEEAVWLEFVDVPSSGVVVPTTLDPQQARGRILNPPNSLSFVKP
jgi:hypothetical protein